MECDTYKMCFEARPLQTLYRKYSPREVSAPHPGVRPLGRVRQEARPVTTLQKTRAQKVGIGTYASARNVKRMDISDKSVANRAANSAANSAAKFKCDVHNVMDSGKDRDVTSFPPAGLSRSQAFEQKYKIAASRANGHESPVSQSSPVLRMNKTYDKKVVQLPLFRINLKSYTGELDVSRTVAKTRESLRRLMELHKSKMKSSNVITANIRNYEFSAPVPSCTLSSRSNDVGPNGLASQQFQSKPAFKSSKSSYRRDYSSIKGNNPFRQSFNFERMLIEPKQQSEQKPTVTDAHGTAIDRAQSVSRRNKFPSVSCDEPDGSNVSMALRPDTSLTLGSTMHQIDRVFKSPSSDELRELYEALKVSDAQPAWPDIDEVQRLSSSGSSPRRLYRRSRTSFTRNGTNTNVILETPDIENELTASARQHEKHVDVSDPMRYIYPYARGGKPILRYTSKPSTFKLDPIVVPSHTCTECPMCNLYSQEVETQCPPNTPNTSHIRLETPETPIHRVPAVKGTRVGGGRPEVMHLTRINVDGMDPTVNEMMDSNVFNFIKST
ncbi:hypothetical protein DPMN_041386 [Dreissena polymorpha]|uniref:Uncharacterized protein n=1 Tax=Dreissena polymorpha TaxID=45954 RepID=A0A9D4CWQ4_DREPO|nr:hypothetical protein DPMN_041386 [Dreissena polymorpha]